MNKKTLVELEFFKLRDEVASFCVSQEGRAELLRRTPSTKADEVFRLKSLALDWAREAQSEVPPPLSSWQPVASLVNLLKAEGAALPAENCLKIGRFCSCSEAMRLWGMGENVEDASGALVRKMAAELPDLSEAHSLIFSVIDEEGNFRELPQLLSIKKRIAEARLAIEKRLAALCSDPQVAPMLQSLLPALRGGRQVLAVKANFRGRIHGIVHEASQSGQTIYVEPADVVELGNELVTEEIHLEREKKEVLRGLAKDLSAFAPSLKAALKTLILFDGLAAACLWGKENACTFALNLPQSVEGAGSESGSAGFRVNLVKARHPFLRKKAVPINVCIPASGGALIITGPNAGGKTVALKTAGLLALINQCGWPVPAAEGTALPVFDFVGCEIGDAQSIEGALSTFSARMQNTARLLKRASAKSLILLDELGSGTDPEEGSSLAMAVLDELAGRGALVIATTHHSAIKHYGFARASCINASVEFDAETLAPTYRLVMGMPGESRAIDIAERSGIPQAVVAAARSYLAGGGADVALLIQKLNEKHAEMLTLEDELRQGRDDLQKMRQELELREASIAQRELELRQDEFGRMREFFIESRKSLENLVRRIREAGGAVTKEETLAVKAWEAAFEQRLEAEEQALRIDGAAAQAALKPASEEQGGEAPPAAIEPGMEVRIAPSGARGHVLRRGKRGFYLVEAGSIKIEVAESRLTAIGGAKAKSGRAASGAGAAHQAVFAQDAPLEAPAFELRLLGMRRAEAVQALIRQIDLCVMTGFREFSVVHGKGTGVLQEAVAEVLKANPAVEEFGFARPEEGGSGKTIVRIKLP